MCAKYYEHMCVFLKKSDLVKVVAFASYSVKFTLFSVSGLKDKKLIKRETYMNTETCKLYSRVFLKISVKCHQNQSL